MIWLVIIQFAPLAAFLAITLGRAKKHAPAVAAGCAAAAFAAFWPVVLQASTSGVGEILAAWIPTSAMRPGVWSDLSVGWLIDPLNLLMLGVVTTVSLFVQLFSIFYMKDEPDRPRYFAFLSFFVFSMTGLVLSASLLQTFMFWELVGLASYLLIGFWFEKKEASEAARKAFVLNRLADIGFLGGVIVLFLSLGTLDISGISSEALKAVLSPQGLTIAALLIFLGVAGKSAQFPFHVWLPDAMEGPTPVSALIHSATMVAAGVFLLARLFPLFQISGSALQVILTTGAITAGLSATMACVQRDLKRILAYSTISQLGLMVMGIAAGGLVPGLFHLTTHAFFKSLLFLTAGAFIHHFGTNDLFEIARKGGRNKWFLMIALAIGLLSLCGVPPLSGFFSKDAILEELLNHHPLFFLWGLGVTALTAFYSFRILFVLWFAKPHKEEHAEAQSIWMKACENGPLAALAGLSILAGFMGSPGGGQLLFRGIGPDHAPAVTLNPFLFVTTFAAITIGGGIAYALYFRSPNPMDSEPSFFQNMVLKPAPGSWVARIRQLLLNKYYIDDAYALLVKRCVMPVARLFQRFDKAVANEFLVHGTARAVGRLGRALSRVQNGLLPDYLFTALALSIIALLWALL